MSIKAHGPRPHNIVAGDPDTGESFTLVELCDHANALEEQVDVLAQWLDRLRGLTLADGRPIEVAMYGFKAPLGVTSAAANAANAPQQRAAVGGCASAMGAVSQQLGQSLIGVVAGPLPLPPPLGPLSWSRK